MSEYLKKLENAIIDLKRDEALKLANELVKDENIQAQDAINAVSSALAEIGDLFEQEEYYLADLVYAGDIAKAVINVLQPILVQERGLQKDPAKRIIVGTVKGDFHDLGKNIVKTFASGAGYEIIDLGSDVPTETFIEKLKEEKIKLLGVSCLLTACDMELDKILTSLKEAGLGDTNVVIGGAAMTELLALELEKKHGIKTRFASDAITGIKIFNELID
ncbi:MAG: cobalamin B12-binding domain-containing protein [Candidatus Helarchaeota archaeon]